MSFTPNISIVVLNIWSFHTAASSIARILLSIKLNCFFEAPNMHNIGYKFVDHILWVFCAVLLLKVLRKFRNKIFIPEIVEIS